MASSHRTNIDLSAGEGAVDEVVSSTRFVEGLVPIPADGLCFYHCVNAARDPLAWMRGRNEQGWVSDRPRQIKDEQDARNHSK